jgi:hypothetical protein
MMSLDVVLITIFNDLAQRIGLLMTGVTKGRIILDEDFVFNVKQADTSLVLNSHPQAVLPLDFFNHSREMLLQRILMISRKITITPMIGPFSTNLHLLKSNIFLFLYSLI